MEINLRKIKKKDLTMIMNWRMAPHITKLRFSAK